MGEYSPARIQSSSKLDEEKELIDEHAEREEPTQSETYRSADGRYSEPFTPPNCGEDPVPIIWADLKPIVPSHRARAFFAPIVAPPCVRDYTTYRRMRIARLSPAGYARAAAPHAACR